MADGPVNPWKMATVGILLVIATAVATTYVVGQRNQQATTQEAAADKAKTTRSSQPAKSQTQSTASSSQGETAKGAESPAASAHPPQSVIDACNQYAEDRVSGKTKEVLTDAAIGAALGAAVGMAGGAIAGGGKKVGKGAAIGGLAGAAGGALYGVNENKKSDERYRTAYASCLRSKGYGN